ncbi:flagellar filament capping protein FliD [Krasilnikovia sp. MM14-A1259]|uniref:flagellar filament capping protein FliD n=1 Tax=Krasilnikovia sp. MM14-A1259 TaxID=3373539 RepID=UPI00381D27D6
MAMAIDGLGSGLNTTDIINQLMQAEAVPQSLLKNKVSTQSAAVSAYQAVNTKVSILATAAKNLSSPDTWGAMKATSSSDAAVVTAQPGASAGALSFRVESMATTHSMTFTGGSVSSASDATGSSVLSGSTFDITLADGSTKTLTPVNGSLNSVVAAINGEANAAYKASAVQIGAGKYTLQLTAKTSGATAAFDASKLPTGLTLGAATTTVQGADAQLRIGEDAVDGSGNPVSSSYTISSATNTFANVLPGLTITATRKQAATDAAVTVNVATDSDAVAAKVQSLVDSMNAALTEISTQTRTQGATTANAGPLAGDFTLSTLRQDLLSSVSRGVTGTDPLNPALTSSFADVGVSLTRDGTIAFDKDKFVASLAADPAKTQRYFESYTETDSKSTANPGGKGTEGLFQPNFDVAQGLGRKLEQISLQATEGIISPGDPLSKAKQGTLQALIQSRNDTISDLNEQVSEWDDRLALRRLALQTQFTALDTALSQMHQQQSWLSGQIASLG